jgi:hypothetical protein
LGEWPPLLDCSGNEIVPRPRQEKKAIPSTVTTIAKAMNSARQAAFRSPLC